MSGKTPNKNLYGAKKIAEKAAEISRRDEKYGQIAIDHERNTKALQVEYKNSLERTTRSEEIIDVSLKEIDNMPRRKQELLQKVQQQRDRIKSDRERLGGKWEAGREAVEKSAKLEAYLSGKSNEEPK